MPEGMMSNRTDSELLRIQELFHGLIRSRVREGRLEVPAELPEVTEDLLAEDKPRWFAVPGMYGGFSYRLTKKDSGLELTAESWCRVVGGSGMRHSITKEEVILREAGFV
jgi:hypothetical protein